MRQGRREGRHRFRHGADPAVGDREYYYAALDRHFPGMKERYIARYGNAYELPSPNAKKLKAVFCQICREHGILSTPDECFRYINELPEKYPQMSMFEL